MKVQIVIAILASVLMAQAEESVKGTLFSSKKEVEEEPGEERVIVAALPHFAHYFETGILTPQAVAGLRVLAEDQANEGKSKETMMVEAIKSRIQK